jgi:hypothetical protein
VCIELRFQRILKYFFIEILKDSLDIKKYTNFDGFMQQWILLEFLVKI